jgi:hypothetical protein
MSKVSSTGNSIQKPPPNGIKELANKKEQNTALKTNPKSY